MTQEEKQLLLKDLCGRLPYGVIVQEPDFYEFPLCIVTLTEILYNDLEVKPYLRPMSSMTEEEREKWTSIINYTLDSEKGEMSVSVLVDDVSEYTDWLNAHYFDYRGLIEKGLALEAPEDMYEI